MGDKKDFIKKKNKLQQLWLKLTDRSGYKQYKVDLKEQELNLIVQSFFRETSTRPDAEKLSGYGDEAGFINISHSGHSGDIIYALPTIKKIKELTGKKIAFYLKLNQSHVSPTNHKHPLGNIMLNEKMAAMLMTLLESQDYIDYCGVHIDQAIHIDLDNFRRAGLQLDRGHIGRWCGYITGVNPELHKAWLHVEPDISYANDIIVARSERYRNPYIDYSFLKKYDNIFFVGVKAEYENMRTLVPNIRWVQVSNFYELAKVIAGCKFFIGNQSFPFALAEGLKVARILETYMPAPNVIPEGENGYDFLFQTHFEWLVGHLNERKDN